MKFIRIGNDIPFRWTLTRLGKPENISDNYEVQLYDKHNARCVIEYTYENNVIIGVFRGMNQHRIGEYCLVYVANKDEIDMSTIDCVNCWKLVPHSYLERGADCCNLSTNPVVLESDLAAPANGLSAYDIALLHGFEGTEEEWLESLSAKALMRLERDPNDPRTWNLLDYKNVAHGSFTVPPDVYITRGTYDNETKSLIFSYNDESGKQEVSCSLESFTESLVGAGLELNQDGRMSIKLAQDNHKALTVSTEGLRLDGTHFAASENELFTELFAPTLYPDY